MARYKDFDAARAENVGEPLTFKLAGREFTTVPIIPAGPAIELARYADEGGAAAVGAFSDFLYAIIAPECRADFKAALSEVDFATLMGVSQWILEETVGRPLEPSGLSSVSSSVPSPSSNGGSPPLVSTLSP